MFKQTSRCPHCNVTAAFEYNETGIRSMRYHSDNMGYNIEHVVCPSCKELVIYLTVGGVEQNPVAQECFIEDEYEFHELIYPMNSSKRLGSEIPILIRNEFNEAKNILNASPKASAALSRRLLQKILHDQFSIKKRNLSKEIDGFINLSDVPSHLADAVDAIRNIGNFAAHPSKDTNTGEIVDVEEGEAEWLLEVLEALFDFAFVQPKRLEKRKKELNEKLKSIGKPPMKGK